MISAKEIVEVVTLSIELDKPGAISTRESFQENGIDSLDVYTIFLSIEEKYQVKFSEEEVNKIKSIDEITSSLNKKMENKT